MGDVESTAIASFRNSNGETNYLDLRGLGVREIGGEICSIRFRKANPREAKFRSSYPQKVHKTDIEGLINIVT